MAWLVDTVQAVTETPLCIDSPDPASPLPYDRERTLPDVDQVVTR